MNVQFRAGLEREGIEQAIDRVERVIRADYPEIRNIYLEVDSLRPRGAASAELPPNEDFA